MKKSNPFRANRQFERFIFNGIPENPQPSWQTNTNAINFSRLTGMPTTTSEIQHDENDKNFKLLGEYEFDHENQIIKFRRL